MSALVSKKLEEKIGDVFMFDIIKITKVYCMLHEDKPSTKNTVIVLDFDFVASPSE